MGESAAGEQGIEETRAEFGVAKNIPLLPAECSQCTLCWCGMYEVNVNILQIIVSFGLSSINIYYCYYRNLKMKMKTLLQLFIMNSQMSYE